MLRIAAIIALSGLMKCGTPATVDPSAPIGRAVPLGDVLWLGMYPYSRGYPTKVVVMAQHKLTVPVEVRGWQCATGLRLRFWYREGLPFTPSVPSSVAKLRRTGSVRAVFGPWPAQGMRGGYFNFWTRGKWKLVARVNGRVVATTVVVPTT